MRYIDTFTNLSGATRQVLVAWGGGLGSDIFTTVAATSSGDLTLSSADGWAVTIENDSSNPAGPATDPPVGYALGGVLTSVGDYSANPFTTPWPGNGNDDLAYVYSFTLAPGESVSLAYFLYRGLQENVTGPLGQTPTTGQEIALAQTTVAGLAANPDFGDLTLAQRVAILNWGFPLQAFTITSASVIFVNNPNRDQFKVQGTFMLDPVSDGIDPVNETVTIAVGTAFVSIPPGSFVEGAPGKFEFQGSIDGVNVKMKIAAGLNQFTLVVEAKQVDLTDTANPLDIRLGIGDDLGETNLRFTGRLQL